jgi:hypothetical protein
LSTGLFAWSEKLINTAMSDPVDTIFASINGSYDRLRNFLNNQSIEVVGQTPDDLITTTGVTRQQRHTIRQWVNSVETGSPEGDYGKATRYKDGKGGSVYQYTLGRSQTTEAGGHVRDLINRYKRHDKENLYDEGLNLYLSKPDYWLAKQTYDVRKPFEEAFRAAGLDPDMKFVQDQFFDERYFIPAYEWCVKHKFKNALSLLVIYDSYIHSGSIMSFLRKRFRATPDDEIAWVSQYTQTRHSWLKNHSRPLLRKTIYRTKSLLHEIENNNWSLDIPLEVNGIVINGKVPTKSVTNWATVESFIASSVKVA